MGLDPLTWLGTATAAVTGDVWKAAMIALWSAGLWILEMAFKVIDAFTTPDLSAGGPLGKALPYTFFLGGGVAVLTALLQIGAAVWRRDGQSLGRVLVGVGQFGLIWVGYLGVAGLLVTAASGLTKGLLQALLGVDAFAGFGAAVSWPRQVDDVVVATVLGLCTVVLIFPAAIGWVLIMLTRDGALMLLTVTAPISAAGLLAESTRVWWWKSLRWFIAALLISPVAALVLGVGVQVLHGVVAGRGDKTTAAVGMAVTGSVLLLISAVCPLILFRLLAFVDPGTSSGAAMREAWAGAGGLTGLLGRGGSAGVAAQEDGQGRAEGEAQADTQTQTRMAGALGMIGSAGARAGAVADRAASIGSDVLALSGVGHQASYYDHAGGYGGATSGGQRTGGRPPGGDTGPEPETGPEDIPPPPPPPLPPPLPPRPSGGSGVGAAPPAGGAGGAGAAGEAGTAGAAGAAGGDAAAAAAVAL
jgi:hypothetical protein